MTYTPGVPQSGQTLGETRPNILTNFTLINQAFGANHVPLTTNATGLHTHVDMTAQAANPNPPATIVSHYSKQVSGITEWFFQREQSGVPPGDVIQMSAGTATSTGVYPNSKGTTFLPGGLMVKWGSTPVVAGILQGSFTQLFAPLGLGNFPNGVLTAFLSCNAPIADKTILSIFSLTTTQIGVAYNHNPTSAFTAFWVVIGN